MISSVFGKTKPVNYILVLSVLFGFYWLVKGVRFGPQLTVDTLPADLLFATVLLFSVLVVNFIVQRNQLTGAHSYAIYFFGLMIVLFPETLLDGSAVIANLFLLLAMRRLISLKSLKDVKSKVFDASLWIAVSSLLVDWMLLFLILVWLYVYFYQPESIRNWLIPLAAVFTVGIMAYAVSLLAGHPGYFQTHYSLKWQGTAEYWSHWRNAVKLALYLAAILVSGFVGFIKLGKSGHGKIVSMRLLAICLLIGMAIVLLRSSTLGNPVILTFFPASVILSKYIESLRRDNIREGMLLGALLLSIVVMLGQWVVK